MLAFLGLGKIQAIAMGALLALLLATGVGAYVLSVRLDAAEARTASLERDVADAAAANRSLGDQLKAERATLALAHELATAYRANRDAIQTRLDLIDQQIREAPRVVVPAQCRDVCRQACRGDPGVWRSLADPPGGVR
jgi:hypothetical protein